MFSQDYYQSFPTEIPTLTEVGKMGNLTFGDKYDGVSVAFNNISKFFKFMPDNFNKEKCLIELGPEDSEKLKEFHQDLTKYLKTLCPDKVFDVRPPCSNEKDVRIGWPTITKRKTGEREEQRITTLSHSIVKGTPPLTQLVTLEELNNRVEFCNQLPNAVIASCKLWLRADQDPTGDEGCIVYTVGTYFTLREVHFLNV